MKIKSLISALLCVVLLVFCASCGPSSKSTTAPATTAPTTTAPTTTNPTSTTTPPPGPVDGPGDAVADDIFNDNWAPGLGN